MTTINNLGVKAKTGELYVRNQDVASDTSINKAYAGTPTSTLAGTTAAVQEVLDLISIENLGDGAPLFAKRDVNAFFFRSLKTTGGLKLTTTGSTITFDSSDLQIPSLKTYLETPTALPNLAGKILIVKSDETGLEWIDAPSGSGATRLTQLLDYPSYTGQAKKVLQVLDDETGVHWTTLPNITTINISDVVGFPVVSADDAGKVLSIDSEGDLVWITTSATGGATAFVQLNDVPNTFVGNGKKILAAKEDETGLEYITVSSISSTVAQNISITDLNNFPTIDVSSEGQVLTVENGSLVWKTVTGGSGATKFTDLTDVPSMTGQGGKYLAVKSDGTGIEYKTLAVPAAGTTYSFFIEWNGTSMQNVTSLPEGWEVVSIAATSMTLNTHLDNSFINFAVAYGKKVNGKWSQWTLGNAASYIEYDDVSPNLLTFFFSNPNAAGTTGSNGIARIVVMF